MMELKKDLGMEVGAFVAEYEEFMKESMKVALDSIDLDIFKVVDDEQMGYFKMLMNALSLLQKAANIAVLEANKIQHIENMLEDLVIRDERLGSRLANIENGQHQLDTRFDGLEEAIRTSGKAKSDK